MSKIKGKSFGKREIRSVVDFSTKDTISAVCKEIILIVLQEYLIFVKKVVIPRPSRYSP